MWDKEPSALQNAMTPLAGRVWLPLHQYIASLHQAVLPRGLGPSWNSPAKIVIFIDQKTPTNHCVTPLNSEEIGILYIVIKPFIKLYTLKVLQDFILNGLQPRSCYILEYILRSLNSLGNGLNCAHLRKVIIFLVTSGCSGVTLLSLLSLKFNALSLLSQCFR